MKRMTIATLVAASILAAAGSRAQDAAKPGEWAGKTVPIEVFSQFPQIDDPRISPDGRWIAAKVRSGGAQALAILGLGEDAGKPRLIARDGSLDGDKQGNRQVAAWRWIDSDHLLITIAFRDNYAGQWFDNIRFAAFNRVTGRIVPLGWDTALGSTQILWTSLEGRPHALLQRSNVRNGTEKFDTPEVIDIDLDTGAYTMAQRPNPLVSGWTADAEGVVRIGSSFDRETGRQRILYRPTAQANFDTIANREVDRYDTTVTIPSLILKGNKAYAYGRQDGFRGLYEFDLSAMKPGRKIFSVPGYDIDSASMNVARDALDGVRYTDTREHAAFFDPRLKEILAVLETQYGKGNVDILSADAKREKIVFRTAALGQVPAFYVFDTVSGGMGRLGWQNETLKDAVLNPVSTIRYPAGDGQRIEAILTMPRHRAGQKNLPLIVMPHGGPWARDTADWDAYQWPQALAELGYVVVQPNYRGSTGYGSAWEKAAEKNWGYRMQDDLNDAVAWLGMQGIADPKRVCMMGWSYGGYAAARAAQRDGAKYRCAISGAGPTDMPAMVNYDKNYLGRYGAKTALGSASTDLADISPALHAEQVSIPILIVHGAKDQRVPVAQSRNFAARLQRAGKVEGKDYVYLEQPLNTHNLLREADRLQLLQTMKTFLEKNNPS